MNAVVDADACTGCELCVDTCPEVFEMADGIAVAKPGEVPAEAQDSCREAADCCPVEAIGIDD